MAVRPPTLPQIASDRGKGSIFRLPSPRFRLSLLSAENVPPGRLVCQSQYPSK